MSYTITAEQLMNALQKANDEESTFFSGFIMNDIGYEGIVLDGGGTLNEWFKF